MTDDTETPGIGHNLPLRVGDDLAAYLEQAYAEDLERTEALLEKGEEFLTIANDQQDADATEFMVKVRARWKESESSRVAEKSPYDDNAGIIHAFFKTRVLDPLGFTPSDLGKRTFDPKKRTDIGLGPRINMAQTLYKIEKAEIERKRREAEARAAAEEERRKREEADRLRREAEAAAAALREAELAAARKRSDETRKAAEAEAAQRRAAAEAAEREAQEARARENRAAEERAAAQAAASAPMAEMSRARGERGGVSSLREFVDVRDIDRALLDYAALGPYFKEAHVEMALREYEKANKATVANHIKNGTQPIRGAIFYIGAKSAGRA